MYTTTTVKLHDDRTATLDVEFSVGRSYAQTYWEPAEVGEIDLMGCDLVELLDAEGNTVDLDAMTDDDKKAVVDSILDDDALSEKINERLYEVDEDCKYDHLD